MQLSAPSVSPLVRPDGGRRRFRRRAAAAGLTAAVLGAGVATAPLAAATPARAARPDGTAPVGPVIVPTTPPGAQLGEALATLLSRDVYQGGIANTVLLTRGNGKLYAYARHERIVTDAELAAVLAGNNPTGHAQFLWAWNRRSYAQTIYALAVNRRAPNPALKAYAVRYLAGAEREVALAVHGLVPAVDATPFAYTLSRTDTLARWSTDLLGAGLPLQYLALESAALSVPRLSVPTAAALDAQRDLTGSVTSPGAQLTRALALLFQAHVYQTGIASFTGFTLGQFTPAYAGATLALDVNSAQLALVVQALFDAAPAKTFLPLWTSHTRDYALYQSGLILGSRATTETAAKNLDGFIAIESAQLHTLVPALTIGALYNALTIHVVDTLQEIDLQAANSPAQFPTATEGANHFIGVADTLAQAIIAEKHLPATLGTQLGQALNRAYTAALAAQ